VRFLRQVQDYAPGQKKDVRLIANRVPPGMSARELRAIFAGQLSGSRACSDPVAFFPREDYLARAGAQHPLVSRDYPDSSLARRTRVWLSELVGRKQRILIKSPNAVSRWLAHVSIGHLPALFRLDINIGLFAIGWGVLLFLQSLAWWQESQLALRPCASGSAGLKYRALRRPFCVGIPSLEISDDDQINP
jgi:hypothetical protein